MKVTIEQFDRETGETYRTFERHPRDERELRETLRSISCAFNLTATRVFVDGVECDRETVVVGWDGVSNPIRREYVIAPKTVGAAA